MNKSVGIVIINYNNYLDTIECVDSILENDYKNYRIILVDNDSNNDSYDILFKKYKYNKYIEVIISNHINMGFSGGNNIGIRRALDINMDYILLLNNDTVVEKNFLTRILWSFSKGSNIGIATGKILYYDKPEIINIAGGKISYLRSKVIPYGENEKVYKCNNYKYVDFASGCFQIIKKEVFDSVGLYDEDYFLYYEDTDFCSRVLRNGYAILYNPESIIWHKVSASSGSKINDLTTYYNVRNRLVFAKKNINNLMCKITFYCYYSLVFSIKMLVSNKSERTIYLKALAAYRQNSLGGNHESINDKSK